MKKIRHIYYVYDTTGVKIVASTIQEIVPMLLGHRCMLSNYDLQVQLIETHECEHLEIYSIVDYWKTVFAAAGHYTQDVHDNLYYEAAYQIQSSDRKKIELKMYGFDITPKSYKIEVSSGNREYIQLARELVEIYKKKKRSS